MQEKNAYMVIGLGNPGRAYERTRHNVGFRVADKLAARLGITFRKKWGIPYYFCRGSLDGKEAIIIKPRTYMNNSGRAVHRILSDLLRRPGDLLVIYDDLNLPLGRIRIRERGSAGGHHGLESIMATLNTEEILRIRLGIGEEQMPEDKADFVLSDFPQQKQAELDDMILKAGNAVKSILTDGVSKTMAIFNA